MLNIFSKIVMFISSYFPLFLIFLVLDFDVSKDYYFEYWILMWIMLWILIISLVLVWFLVYYVFDNILDFNIQNDIASIENSNHEILAYLFAYVIPFVSMGTEKKIIILSILMFVSFIVFLKSELIKYNIFLLLIWFDIIKVTLIDNRSIFLIKKTWKDINIWEKIVYWKIANNLYFLKKD